MSRFMRFIPVLKVLDIEQSIGYYTRVLGFRLCWRIPNDGGGENAMIESGGLSLMVSTGNHLGDRPLFSGTLYVEMDGIDEFYQEVKDRVTIVWPLEVMPYGQKEFGIRDCNGYILAFAEAMAI